jgi:hypothetical protein
MTYLSRHSIGIVSLIVLCAGPVGAVQRGCGVFEVRDGRVVALETRMYTLDYDSVDAFAAALANPPPTVVRVR